MKKTTTKKLIMGMALSFLGTCVLAQNGLENVIVESYYVSDLNDANNSIGTLPVGSKTYRVFVDMRQGYRFQAMYGVTGHPFTVSTTTTFFNNEDRGATTPNGINTPFWNDGTVGLDSWFSVGSAGNGHIGVLKADDDGVSNILMPNSLLQNNDPWAGIALTSQDGIILGTPEAVTFVGINNTGNGDLGVLDGTSQVGGLFTTSNGSVASLNGSYGDSATTNRVLVGQFTTDGCFEFHLNIQIGLPNGSSQYENYVATAPNGNEILASFLNYNSCTVGLVDQPAASPSSSIDIYPNPASDVVTIDITSSDKINSNSYRIFDVIGNVISSKDLGTISGKYVEKLDISSFAKGIYFIETTLNGVKSTKKIIKY